METTANHNLTALPCNLCSGSDSSGCEEKPLSSLTLHRGSYSGKLTGGNKSGSIITGAVEKRWASHSAHLNILINKKKWSPFKVNNMAKPKSEEE